MPTSFIRRMLLSLSAVPKTAIVLAAVAAGFLISGSTVTQADFDPTSSNSLSSNATGANADLTTILNIPSPDYNFSAVVTGTPGTVEPSPDHPSFSSGTDPILGDIGANLLSDTILGLNNGACNFPLDDLPFTMLVATVDNSSGNEIDPIPPGDTGPLGTLENMGTDEGDAPGAGVDPGPVAPANGLPASVELYPSYLNDIFANEQPLRRLVGNTIVAGSQVSLNFVVFAPGQLQAAFDPPHPFADLDPSMGHTSVSILNDPTGAPAPSSITDFCSPLDVNTVTLGTTETNQCNGTTANPCDTTSGIGNPNSAGDNTGRVASANPGTAGTYLYVNFVQSLRDLDGDGFENAFDTCPTVANTDNGRVTNGTDGDMLDPACDPTPATNSNSGNHDLDTSGSPARGWQNGQDNCPLVSNNDQKDSEGEIPGPAYSDSAPRGGPKSDSIGDACDADDTIANGQFHTVLNLNANCIGGTDADADGWCATGGSQPNDPNDGNPGATPETYSLVFPTAVAHSGSGVNSGVGGTVSAGLGLDFCDGASAGDAGCVNASNNAGRGQPHQVCSDGVDNDLDTLIDLEDDGCEPVGLSSTDTDGDGYSDETETHVGTDALGRCEVGGSPARSTDWPSDFTSGGIPDSTDKIVITDLTSFLAPTRRLDTSPGDANFDQRWDLTPGKGFFANWIVINDLTALIAGNSGTPPMFGVRAFGGPTCSAHPTFGD